MIVGLSGYARSGKDTVASLLAEDGFQRVAFADKLRDVALELDPFINDAGCIVRLSKIVHRWGWERAKQNGEVRRTLQRLGVAVRERLGEDTWVNAALAGLGDGDYVVTDVRFPNEAAAIKARGGIILRLHRPGYAPVNGHVSETALDDYPFDAVIENGGTLDDLKRRALIAIGTRY